MTVIAEGKGTLKAPGEYIPGTTRRYPGARVDLPPGYYSPPFPYQQIYLTPALLAAADAGTRGWGLKKWQEKWQEDDRAALAEDMRRQFSRQLTFAQQPAPAIGRTFTVPIAKSPGGTMNDCFPTPSLPSAPESLKAGAKRLRDKADDFDVQRRAQKKIAKTQKKAAKRARLAEAQRLADREDAIQALREVAAGGFYLGKPVKPEDRVYAAEHLFATTNAY